MIRVEGDNPRTLGRRLSHHAQALIPLSSALIDAIVFGPLGQDDRVHVIKQHKRGANSFSLTPDGGASFHFRGREDYSLIDVLDSFQNGAVIATIRTADDAEAFVSSVVSAGEGS